jgi:hypothetical protein
LLVPHLMPNHQRSLNLWVAHQLQMQMLAGQRGPHSPVQQQILIQIQIQVLEQVLEQVLVQVLDVIILEVLQVLVQHQIQIQSQVMEQVLVGRRDFHLPVQL